MHCRAYEGIRDIRSHRCSCTDICGHRHLWAQKGRVHGCGGQTCGSCRCCVFTPPSHLCPALQCWPGALPAPFLLRWLALQLLSSRGTKKRPEGSSARRNLLPLLGPPFLPLAPPGQDGASPGRAADCRGRGLQIPQSLRTSRRVLRSHQTGSALLGPSSSWPPLPRPLHPSLLFCSPSPGAP